MGTFVARNDTFIAGIDFILSRIGAGTEFQRTRQRALRRP